MIRYGHPVEGLERLPLAAALGSIYTYKLTGTLKVYDCGGTSVPFVFWFKRGFPCHSYSRDGIGRLGEQFERRKRSLVEGHCSRHNIGQLPNKQMLGQQLLSESLVSMEELQEALVRQLTGRLLCCASTKDTRLEFDEGMDEFGVVPLASPLLNPIEVGARAALAGPHERMRAYLLEHVNKDSVRLARDRRIPPVVRQHLASPFLDGLQKPNDLGRILDTPSRMRTLTFLHAFGFVELLDGVPQTDPLPVEASSTPAEGPFVDALADMVRLIGQNASHYELLGLPFDASRDQIKQVYRHVAFLIHPDRVPADRVDESRRVFPRLVEAYHNLGKERLRVKYDRDLVTLGQWHGLGGVDEMKRMVGNRKDRLAQMGLTTLASEYTRMLGMLDGPTYRDQLATDTTLGQWW